MWAVLIVAAVAAVHTRTDEVAAITVARGAVWVATRGGVETYDPGTYARTRVYTTADGLASNDVRGLRVEGGSLIARTADAACYLADGGARFACAPAPRLANVVPAIAPMAHGHRTTATFTLPDGRTLVGTSGGLWLGERRLTPDGEVCGNHVMAFAVQTGGFAPRAGAPREPPRGALWLGTFDQGLCRWNERTFVQIKAPFRMVNDLAATPRGLFIAAGEGLFVTRDDGRTFTRVADAPETQYNDLAFDGVSVYATTPAVVRRIPASRGAPRARAWWLPGGSHAMQAVAVSGGAIWIASEDRGALKITGRDVAIFDRAAGFPSSWAVDVAALPDGGAVVATLRHGLWRIAPDGTVHAMAAPDPWLLSVTAGPGGALWVGAQGGAAVIDGPTTTSLGPLPDPNVHAITVHDGAVWVGTEGGTAVIGCADVGSARVRDLCPRGVLAGR